MPSRPHLEWQLRRRVQDIDNAEIVRRSVGQPRFDRARQRVTGVLLDGADSGAFVSADLVVDAAGRGSRLPVWLTQWGYQRPAEETIDIGVNYASQLFRIPEGLIPEKVVVTGASADQPLAIGSLYYEDGVPVLTTFGVADAEARRQRSPRCGRWQPSCCRPMSLKRWHRPNPSASRRTTPFRPAGGAATTSCAVSPPASSRSVTRSPASTPPTGMGMTIAALQAGHLLRALQSPDGALARRLDQPGHRQDQLSGVDSRTRSVTVTFHHAQGRARPPGRWLSRQVRCSTDSWRPPNPNPFSPNRFCAGCVCSTTCASCRPRGRSAAPVSAHGARGCGRGSVQRPAKGRRRAGKDRRRTLTTLRSP